MSHCECDSPSRKKSVGGAKLKDKMLGEWHAWTSPLENMLAQKLGKYMAQKPRRHEAVNMQMREIADAAMKAAKEGNEELMNKLLALLESKSKEPLSGGDKTFDPSSPMMREIAEAAKRQKENGDDGLMRIYLDLLAKSKEPLGLGGRKPQMTGGFDLFGEAEKLIKGVVHLPQPDKAVMGVINGGRKRCAQPRSGGQRPPGMPPGWKPAHMYGGFWDPVGDWNNYVNSSVQPLKLGSVIAGKIKQPSGGRKTSARGAIVKKVMAEHGLSLPQASKYVKEHGLY
jgi:hypothetical protein